MTGKTANTTTSTGTHKQRNNSTTTEQQTTPAHNKNQTVRRRFLVSVPRRELQNSYIRMGCIRSIVLPVPVELTEKRKPDHCLHIFRRTYGESHWSLCAGSFQPDGAFSRLWRWDPSANVGSRRSHIDECRIPRNPLAPPKLPSFRIP